MESFAQAIASSRSWNGHDGHDRPERLLADDRHVLAAVGDDGRRVVVALRPILGALAADDDAGLHRRPPARRGR